MTSSTDRTPIEADRRNLALVTGAAHRLGKAIAVELGRQGFAIGLHYHRSKHQAEATAAELAEAGVPVYLLEADLADPLQIEDLFARVAALRHPLKVLVNSAAVMTRGDLLSMPLSEIDYALALNLRAPLLCARQAARLMPPGSLIVNVSDAGAHKAWTVFPVYALTKAGVDDLTRLLARLLAPNIRVNAVAPGLTLRSDNVTEEDWARLVSRVPLKRPAAPEEIGQAVAFLWKNEYITGQTLVVDGGYQLV